MMIINVKILISTIGGNRDDRESDSNYRWQ